MYTSLLGSALAYGAFFYFASKGSLTKLSCSRSSPRCSRRCLVICSSGRRWMKFSSAGAAVTIVGIYLVNTRALEGQEEKEA